MQLNRENIASIHSDAIQLPGRDLFDLPEKVLQFGTGVLLRGLPGYYIDKANKRGVFNGRIVMVKSTVPGGVADFKTQDGLYTHCLRGFEDGRIIEENVVNASVSRVLTANKDWEEVLQFATDPQLQLIISNTTEIGITLVAEKIDAMPPASFPGKLLAVLYKRYQYFNGDVSKGVVIVPTELVPNNAGTLRSIILQLAEQNHLGENFNQWLHASTNFCNSLVDRIVPGKLAAAAKLEMEQRLGYTDDLMIMSETYGLWAIEASGDNVKDVLSFHETDSGIIISPDISIYRELKLRLLNGSHTFSCGLAFLAGFATVKQAMADVVFESFITSLMMNEIATSIPCEPLSEERARSFAGSVLDRYRNPFMEHQWINITLQYSSKMNTRNAPLINGFVQRNGTIPQCMSLGLAAWILFMKCERSDDGRYYGEVSGQHYPVNDDHASIFEGLWKNYPVDQLVEKVLSNRTIWQADLSELNGLTADVSRKLSELMDIGPRKMMQQLMTQTQIDSKLA